VTAPGNRWVWQVADWHLDKRVPVALILTLTYEVGGVELIDPDTIRSPSNMWG